MVVPSEMQWFSCGYVHCTWHGVEGQLHDWRAGLHQGREVIGVRERRRTEICRRLVELLLYKGLLVELLYRVLQEVILEARLMGRVKLEVFEMAGHKIMEVLRHNIPDQRGVVGA